MADALVGTDSVDASDREAFWHHVLADNFAAAVHLERWADHPEPTARLSATRRGRLLFTELEATPQIHRRTRSQINQADSSCFQAAILTKGAASLQQEDRITLLSPGDLVVYENSRPFTWTFTDSWSFTVLSIPSDAVRLSDSERRAMSARSLSGQDGLSGVVTRFVTDLARNASAIPDVQSERILAQVSDLVISLFATAANAEYADARHRTLLDEIKGYIEIHFRDPGLTPDEIAAAANISTRYLHKLFEGEHETVALYVRGLRLQRARQELLDPRLAHRGVATIAHGCGIGDISGFNRAFKSAYGITPSELRRSRVETPQQSVPTPRVG